MSQVKSCKSVVVHDAGNSVIFVFKNSKYIVIESAAQATIYYITNKLMRNMSNCEVLNRPIENSIKGKLEAALKPLHCNVINESYMHNVPKNSETHFKVVVVSEKFDKQPLIKRHRMINQLLQAELQGGVHALSIVAKTPEQWEASNKTVAASPVCRGGFGK